MVTVFVAGVAAASARPAAGQALIDFLRTPQAAGVLRTKGLDPA